MSKDLILPLQTQWFDMWKSGKKKFDYRDIKPYWAKRFCKNYSKDCTRNFLNEDIPLHCESCDFFEQKTYRRLILTKGYPKSDEKEKRIKKDYPYIFIEKGCKELGSLPDTYYFVVTSND